jgi:VanZ family protein
MIVLCGIIFISILTDPPHPDDISNYVGGIPLNDKVGHVAMFFVLGFLISNFLMNLFKHKGLKNVIVSTGLTFLVGIIHEINQCFVGRGYEIGDLAFDLIGGFLGTIAWHVLIRIKSRLSNKASQDTSVG